MRDTSIFYQGVLTPALVRFDAPTLKDNLIIINETINAIYIDTSAISVHDFTINPTRELLDRLSELRSIYSTAWLPGSQIPSERAFQDAKAFIETLPLTQMIKPAIHVASDGEVNFQWSGPDFKIDLGFYGNEKFSFYGAKSGHAPLIGDETPVKAGIPKALQEFATAV